MERALGRDVANQQQHVGNRTRSSVEAHVHSFLLELRVEGPQREEALFTVENGALVAHQCSKRLCSGVVG